MSTPSPLEIPLNKFHHIFTYEPAHEILVLILILNNEGLCKCADLFEPTLLATKFWFLVSLPISDGLSEAETVQGLYCLLLYQNWSRRLG